MKLSTPFLVSCVPDGYHVTSVQGLVDELLVNDDPEYQAYTFLNNGGYNRNFSEGELDLKPLVTYDLDANTVRETTTFETGWGEVFANSEEEAIEKFTNNPENWVSDSEHDETDYGDYKEVYDVKVTNTNERHLTLLNLGFA